MCFSKTVTTVLTNESNFIQEKKRKKKKTRDKDTGRILWLYINLDFQYFTNKLKVKPC